MFLVYRFFKWFSYNARTSFQPETPGCAPSVLIMFINMMLFKNTEPPKGCDEFMFESQPQLQKTFVLIGLCCIPWMLLGKPLYIKFTRKNKAHVGFFFNDFKLNFKLIDFFLFC